MTILEIEREIIARLKEKIQNVAIEAFPEKPAEFRLIHPKGALLVHYAGSDFLEPKTTDIVYQERRVQFAVTVVMRHLRTHEGAYAYLDAVRIALAGFQLPGCTKMYPVKEEFIGEENGIWQYGIAFVIKMPALEVGENEQAVLLKKITTIDQLNEETLEVQK